VPAVTADPLTVPSLSTAPAGATARTVLSRTRAPSGNEGEGFPVRRAFAGIDTRLLDPFIHMDQMGEVEYAPGEPKGTPWHPHRGFETFTYIIDGEFVHQDSHGGGGSIADGATQYMTAGSGVMHIETPPEHLVMSGGLFHGVQLWINLPRAQKWVEPAYQDLSPADVVLLSSADGGALVRLLAGHLDGHTGPGVSRTPVTVLHLTLAPGASTTIPWPADFNALAYTLAGSGRVGPDGVPVSTGDMAVFSPGGDTLTFHGAPAQDSRTPTWEVFVLGGLPIREPVVAYGPFVMNTRAEILQALEDFQGGRFAAIPPGAIQPFHVSP